MCKAQTVDLPDLLGLRTDTQRHMLACMFCRVYQPI